jgi:hypothetical protein
VNPLWRYPVLLVILVLLALVACTKPAVELQRPSEITDHTPPAQVTPAETMYEGIPVLVMPSSSTADRNDTSPTQYEFDVELDYDAKSLTVTQTIIYTNNTGRAIYDLPILVPPAYRDGVFFLSMIEIEPPGRQNESIFHDARIDLMIDPPLAPGKDIEIRLKYQLRLPMRYEALGYTDRQILLADWYPQIPLYLEGTGWLINPPGLVGEHLVYPLNNFQLNLCLLPSRDDLIVAASVPPTETQNDCYQFTTSNKRNISLAISPYYQLATATSDLVTVTAYTFPEHVHLGQRATKLAVEAWSIFTDLYGPNNRDFLSIVEADIYDGLETDGLIYLSEWYYQTVDPSPRNYFELLIVHETAHQWFYGYIHNDPASEPWLDEALATYSEILYLEHQHPELVRWWWNFRVETYAPEGSVNTPIYKFNDDRPYINAVYLRGAIFLQALRKELGDAAFFEGLLQYIQTNGGPENFRATNDFFEVFTQVSDADLSTIIGEYFK